MGPHFNRRVRDAQTLQHLLPLLAREKLRSLRQIHHSGDPDLPLPPPPTAQAQHAQQGTQ